MISFSNRKTRSKGFSLLELLIVIGVISILLGMLLTAIRTVTQHTRRTIARAEVRMLEGAWKQYFTHYQRWPTNAVFVQGMFTGSDFDGVFVITDYVAKGLEGRIDDDTVKQHIPGFNPDGIAFMEFTRYRRDNGSGAVPINPAQISISVPTLPSLSEPSNTSLDGRMFFCRLNILEEETLTTPPPERLAVPRDVIVWTYDERFFRDPENPRYLIGSWQQ